MRLVWRLAAMGLSHRAVAISPVLVEMQPPAWGTSRLVEAMVGLLARTGAEAQAAAERPVL